MESNSIWFYLVLFVAGSFAQHLGFWEWVSAVAKFVAVGFWKWLWKTVSAIPEQLAEIGGKTPPALPPEGSPK